MERGGEEPIHMGMERLKVGWSRSATKYMRGNRYNSSFLLSDTRYYATPLVRITIVSLIGARQSTDHSMAGIPFIIEADAMLRVPLTPLLFWSFL